VRDTGRAASRERQQRNARRHQARILAMQILYESEVTGHSPSEILVRTRSLGGTPDETLAYASDLLTGVRARGDAIRNEIEIAAPDFPAADIAIIDRTILEVALFEALFGGDVPPRVAINEAVGIAREYGGEASSRFVNAVLGQIIDRLHPEASRAR
jgi:transcription antitermination protein NusB